MRRKFYHRREAILDWNLINEFADFVFTTINDIYKGDEKVRIKRKAVYFI